MTNVLRVAIVDPDDASRDSLKTMLLSMEVAWLEAECSRYEFFADVVGQTVPDIGIVALDNDSGKALALVSQLSSNCPECGILCVSSSHDGQLILQAMRAGAKEFLPKPIQIEDLHDALHRITSRRSSSDDGMRARGSRVISVTGTAGGIGATTIAVNLASAMAKRDRAAVLVDLDMGLGDADVFLDTIPDYTLVDVAQNISRLDITLLKRSLARHESGVYLLPRPLQLEEVTFISEEDLGRVIGLLKATFVDVVLDISKSFAALDMSAIRASDIILLVLQLELPCLRNAVRLLTSIREMDGIGEKIRVLVNRYSQANAEISLRKAEETLECEIFGCLPNDYKAISESRNAGIPLVDFAPKAPITQNFSALVDALDSNVSMEKLAASGKKFGWGNLFGGLLPAKK